MLSHLNHEIRAAAQAILNSGDRSAAIFKYMAEHKATDTALRFANDLATDSAYLQIEKTGSMDDVLAYVTKQASRYTASDDELALVLNVLAETAPKKPAANTNTRLQQGGVYR